MIVRLFDLMSGNSELEHPLCEECTESLLEKLDKEHQQYEEELKLYKYLNLIIIIICFIEFKLQLP